MDLLFILCQVFLTTIHNGPHLYIVFNHHSERKQLNAFEVTQVVDFVHCLVRVKNSRHFGCWLRSTISYNTKITTPILRDGHQHTLHLVSAFLNALP